MNEGGATLENTDQEDFHKESTFVRTIRFAGSIFSLLILVLIIYWTVTLYKRDIEDLPIISNLNDDLRSRPIDPGGEEINYKGLSVNKVIAKQANTEDLRNIKLAPASEELDIVEKEPAIVITDEENEDNVNMANNITRALENFLNIRTLEQNETQQNVELHLGAFETEKKAYAYWNLLKQVNADLLTNSVYKIIKNGSSEQSYRLRLVGFESTMVAKNLCEKLSRRGEKCVPAQEE